jgi:uncharacterized membrane protein
LLWRAIIALARLGQGGSRMATADGSRLTSSTVPIGDRTPDRYWKLGILYFNRDDPAVLVEKRFGLGYSLNFARPIAWMIVLLALIGPLVPILAHLYLWGGREIGTHFRGSDPVNFNAASNNFRRTASSP